MSADQQRYAYIDALRGYAILGVIAVHSGLISLPFPLREWAKSGEFGVQLFFVVSAMTLMMSWHSRSDGAIPFYIRRLFRIAPMFWLAIPFYFVIYGAAPRYWAPSGISLWEIGATAAFLHGWHPNSFNSVVPGGWSIAAEMTFYWVFPMLAVALTSWWRLIVALIAAMVLARLLNPSVELLFLQTIAPDQPAYLSRDLVYYWFINQLPVFLIGMGAFYALRVDIPRRLLWLALAFALALLPALPLVYLPGPQHLKYALVFAVIAICLGRDVGGWLVSPAICQLGKVSYSAYLWHFAVIEVLKLMPFSSINFPGILNAIIFVLLFATVTLVTFGLSRLTYTYVEKPFIAIGGRVASRVAASGKQDFTAENKLQIAS